MFCKNKIVIENTIKIMHWVNLIKLFLIQVFICSLLLCETLLLIKSEI